MSSDNSCYFNTAVFKKHFNEYERDSRGRQKKGFPCKTRCSPDHSNAIKHSRAINNDLITRRVISNDNSSYIQKIYSKENLSAGDCLFASIVDILLIYNNKTDIKKDDAEDTGLIAQLRDIFATCFTALFNDGGNNGKNIVSGYLMGALLAGNNGINQIFDPTSTPNIAKKIEDFISGNPSDDSDDHRKEYIDLIKNKTGAIKQHIKKLCFNANNNTNCWWGDEMALLILEEVLKCRIYLVNTGPASANTNNIPISFNKPHSFRNEPGNRGIIYTINQAYSKYINTHKNKYSNNVINLINKMRKNKNKQDDNILIEFYTDTTGLAAHYRAILIENNRQQLVSTLNKNIMSTLVPTNSSPNNISNSKSASPFYKKFQFWRKANSVPAMGVTKKNNKYKKHASSRRSLKRNAPRKSPRRIITRRSARKNARRSTRKKASSSARLAQARLAQVKRDESFAKKQQLLADLSAAKSQQKKEVARNNDSALVQFLMKLPEKERSMFLKNIS